MKKLAILFGMFLACCQVAEAVVVQKIILKNGSELNGYIQKQDDKGNLTFQSDFALICLKADDVKRISDGRAYDIKSLDKAWIDWAEKHDAFEGTGDGRKLVLHDIVTKDKTVMKVRILERGATVKYLEMAPGTYFLQWKDVEAIRGEKRPKTALSGINRIYKLKSGQEVEGEYAGETDTTLSLYLDNGVVQSFKIDDVVKYTFRPVNPDQTLFEQSELLDVIRLKKGMTEMKGIIIEQNYGGKNDSENYFLLQQADGAIQSVKVSDIDEVRKEINPRYSPKYDVLLAAGEVMVNRQKVTAVNVTEDDDLLVLASAGKNPDIQKGDGNTTLVTVEYNCADGAGTEVFQLVKVTTSVVKKKTVYSFSYKDLVNASYRPVSLETSVNNTTKVEYKIDRTGMFALYDAKSRTAIPFVIKK